MHLLTTLVLAGTLSLAPTGVTFLDPNVTADDTSTTMDSSSAWAWASERSPALSDEACGDDCGIEIPVDDSALTGPADPGAPAVTSTLPGVALVGEATEVTASATRHIRDADAGGHSTPTRLTPISTVVDFGDGTVVTRPAASAGDSTELIERVEHTYREAGAHTVTVTVTYATEVMATDGRWAPLDRQTTSTSTYPLHVRATKSALVNFTCIENPDGVGC